MIAVTGGRTMAEPFRHAPAWRIRDCGTAQHDRQFDAVAQMGDLHGGSGAV